MVAGMLVALVLAPKTTVIELDAMIGSQRAGQTTWTTTTDAAGGLTVVIDGTLILRGATRRGIGRYVYRKDGRPISSEFRGSGQGPSFRTLTTYGASSVTVQEFSDGQLASTKKIAIPKSAKLIDGASAWFRKRVPKKGETASYDRLGNGGTWERSTTTYVGKATLQLKGKAVPGHVIESSGLKTWLDDRGDLLGSDLLLAGQTVSLRRTSITRS